MKAPPMIRMSQRIRLRPLAWVLSSAGSVGAAIFVVAGIGPLGLPILASAIGILFSVLFEASRPMPGPRALERQLARAIHASLLWVPAATILVGAAALVILARSGSLYFDVQGVHEGAVLTTLFVPLVIGALTATQMAVWARSYRAAKLYLPVYVADVVIAVAFLPPVLSDPHPDEVASNFVAAAIVATAPFIVWFLGVSLRTRKDRRTAAPLPMPVMAPPR